MKNPLSIAKLERRMRPGVCSTEGFLGPTESLEVVLTQDNQALSLLGVSCTQIADALERVLQTVKSQSDRLLMEDYPEYRKRQTHFPHLARPEALPLFSLEALPDLDKGYLVDNKFQVFVVCYRGGQNCPWSCRNAPWSNLDFLILNRQSGKQVTGPGLIVHLIREHQFFEGIESPYRVDPIRVSEVLEIIPET